MPSLLYMGPTSPLFSSLVEVWMQRPAEACRSQFCADSDLLGIHHPTLWTIYGHVRNGSTSITGTNVPPSLTDCILKAGTLQRIIGSGILVCFHRGQLWALRNWRRLLHSIVSTIDQKILRGQATRRRTPDWSVSNVVNSFSAGMLQSNQSACRRRRLEVPSRSSRLSNLFGAEES
ncbi:hypothetical protein CC80DRAFT_183637 [Byssothecium circinans]|uniref:Uncharacterized protein n=1 Tax=Byssothecium circinans TaxID=147558 RepID=A0A6A5THC0_9PLEO|nr:hypothetical protein CC80DRAFT_183637 [Byssothecium circinans]